MKRRLSDRVLSAWVYTAPSTIHGTGLFAKKKIRQGSYIGSYAGPRIDWHPDQDYDHTYILWIEDENGWQGIDGQNLLRYLNHAEDYNAEFDGADLYACRDIQAGEEITFYYGEEFAASLIEKPSKN